MTKLTTIRRFRIAYTEYRHVIDLDTDDVLLQCYNEDAEKPEDEWQSLLKFDSSCGVWAAGSKAKVGDFRMEGDTWVYYENPLRTRIAYTGRDWVEALLDFEVEISKRWLAANPDLAVAK